MSLFRYAAQMRRTGAFAAAVGVVLLASGVAFAQEAKKTPIPAGKARLTLTRVSTLLYSGAAAIIKVNDQEVASVWNGGTVTADVTPGANTLTASGALYPGAWTLKLNMKAGQNYAFEIQPRSAGVGTAVMFGAIGGAIEASSNPGKNTGLFEMKMKGKK